jgi:anti-sigma B factor antagonist
VGSGDFVFPATGTSANLSDVNIVLTITEDDPAIIRIAGEIDMCTAPTLRRVLLDLLAAGSRRLVLDLDEVDFLDSAGLNALAAVLKQTRFEGGSLCLVCSNPRIVRLLAIIGPPKDLPIHRGLEDALRAEFGWALDPAAPATEPCTEEN